MPDEFSFILPFLWLAFSPRSSRFLFSPDICRSPSHVTASTGEFPPQLLLQPARAVTAINKSLFTVLINKTLLISTECYSNMGNTALFRIILTSITYLWRLRLHKDNKRRWSNRLWLSTYLLSAPRTPKQTSDLSLTQVLKPKSAQSWHARHIWVRLWCCLVSDYRAVALMWRIYGNKTLTLEGGSQSNVVLIEAAQL